MIEAKRKQFYSRCEKVTRVFCFCKRFTWISQHGEIKNRLFDNDALKYNYEVPEFFEGCVEMLKIEIKLNEKLVEEEGKYTLLSIYQTLDNLFSKYDFRKSNLPDGTISYCGNGKKQDYGAFGHLIITLKTKQWFVPYLEKWLWYNSDDGIDENDYAIEDILYFYTKRESVA